MMKTLVVGAGGFVGASARYLLGGLAYRLVPSAFPHATFLVNVSGCFGIGFAAVLAEERFVIGPGARLFWMVGVLGGYTTTRILRLSEDLPIVVEIVDAEDKIQAFLPVLEEMVKEGLATVEKATVIFYRAGSTGP